MNKISQLLSLIRDFKILELKLFFENSMSYVELDLLKNDKLAKVKLVDIKHIDIFDDLIQQEYIGEIKGGKYVNNKYWFSLDPCNERIDKIEEADNYVFIFNDFEIV